MAGRASFTLQQPRLPFVDGAPAEHSGSMAHKGPRIRQPGAQEVAAATLQELLPAENDSLDFVRHPRARRYVLRVRADGTVRVTIPRGGSRREGGAFAERERTWIEAERRRLALERARPREDVPAELEKSLRNQATRELPVRVFELAAQHSLQVTRVSVRNQRWRWGSCSRSGHICLNWRLVQMPAAVRDYVIVHELMHLKRMDHSPRFWRLVAEVCPDYLAARAWLREHGRSSS